MSDDLGRKLAETFTVLINLLFCDFFVYISLVRTCNVLIVRGHEILISIDRNIIYDPHKSMTERSSLTLVDFNCQLTIQLYLTTLATHNKSWFPGGE